jgi:hypothetical protein
VRPGFIGHQLPVGRDAALPGSGSSKKWSRRHEPQLSADAAICTQHARQPSVQCLSVVFGRVQDLLLSAKHLFLAAKARPRIPANWG